jgi:hypothetical protein
MALFSLLSSWLEGTPCQAAARGYFRDGKRGKYGLLTDPSGRHVAVRMFDGSTADPAVVTGIVKVVREKFIPELPDWKSRAKPVQRQLLAEMSRLAVQRPKPPAVRQLHGHVGTTSPQRAGDGAVTAYCQPKGRTAGPIAWLMPDEAR